MTAYLLDFGVLCMRGTVFEGKVVIGCRHFVKSARVVGKCVWQGMTNGRCIPFVADVFFRKSNSLCVCEVASLNSALIVEWE